MSCLPWGALTDFLSLRDVLTLRLVSREWNQSLNEGASMEWCRANLSTILKGRNSFLFESSNGSLDSSWQIGATQNNMQDLLLSKHPKATTCLGQLLKVLRVIQSLPQAIVVADSDKYGRQCWPVQYDKTSNTSQIVEWGSCQGVNYLRPQNRAPSENPRITSGKSTANQDGCASTNTNIIPPTCIPNLPSDLICPKCHINGARTLVLSEFSYRAQEDFPRSRLAHANLVWNPHLDNTHTMMDPDCDISSSPSKRVKKDSSTCPTLAPFPPRYVETALPTRSEPIPLQRDAKFCISIHCTACREFAIWAPASVCRHVDYVCHERGRQIQSDNTTLCGALVRTKCSLPDCNQAIACPYCAHQVWHEPYTADGEQRQVRHVSHCDVCRETYCSDHAWVSTVCHHW